MVVELSAPAQMTPSNRVLVDRLIHAAGPAIIRADRQVWRLRPPFTLDLAELGEIRLLVPKAREIDLVVPRSLASWVREVRAQEGRPMPVLGKKHLHLSFTLPFPTRLPLLGLDLRLDAADG